MNDLLRYKSVVGERLAPQERDQRVPKQEWVLAVVAPELELLEVGTHVLAAE
jgi:hypothetical protein